MGLFNRGKRQTPKGRKKALRRAINRQESGVANPTRLVYRAPKRLR